MVHCETSTGVLNDVNPIREWCQQQDILLCLKQRGNKQSTSLTSPLLKISANPGRDPIPLPLVAEAR
jgi:hypothetical protein